MALGVFRMRSVVIALAAVGVLAGPVLGVINVKLTADDTSLEPGQTTTVRVLVQGTSAGIYSLAGSIIASGTPGTLVANGGSLAWVPAFARETFPASVLGAPGNNGGWSSFGSIQNSFLNPDKTFAKADYVELASYTVTAQPGSGLVVLSFVAGPVGGHKPLECDITEVLGTFTPVAIAVGSALAVSPSSDLNSSGDAGGPFIPSSRIYTVSNPGTAATTWTVSKTQTWVSLSKAGGTLAPGDTDTVTVTINAGANGLAAGSYTDTVSFTNTTSGVGNTTRAVSLMVATPGQLSVSPSGGLSSSGNAGGPFSPASITYTLNNAGDSSITWTASKALAWVSLSKTGGTLAAGGSDSVTVSINTGANSLDPGSYSDTVRFTNTTNGIGSTTRAVSLTVTSPGQLSVSPSAGLSSSGDVGGPFDPASITYTLHNPGDSAVTWTVGKTQDWVSLSKAGGTLAGGASDSVTVSINTGANSLGVGSYSDTVTFTNTTNAAGNTTRAVNLTVTSEPAGRLAVSPIDDLSSSGTAGGPFSPAAKTYTLENTGDAAITWSAGKTRPWVSLSKTAGSLDPGATDTVTVSINASANSLAAGDYADTVTFTNTTNATGNTARQVNLTVTSPGRLVITPSGGLSSSGVAGGPFSPADVTYTLSNAGDTPIQWAAGKTRAWVTLSKTGGMLGGGDITTVAVSINAGADALAAGSYSDTVTFTNVTNGQGTGTRSVSLTVLLAGDVDDDGEVSILDVLRFAWAYGTHQGQPGFDPDCDFNRDGTVDLGDLSVLVENFGKKVAG
jgi:hypothetical protein